MKLKKKSFTLIEVLAVFVIWGILSAIAVPVISGIIEKTEKEVCIVNFNELERMYHSHLDLEGIDHKDEKIFIIYV